MVKSFLMTHDVAQEDIVLVEEFLRYLGFVKRQQFMGILLGWPDKVSLFIDILKKKKALAEQYDKNLAQEIFDLEQKEITHLMKEINQ